jgi:ribosomal protein L7Ae-like RNA K-turn-binding protein
MVLDTLDVNPKAGINPIMLEAINAFVANEHEESHDRVDLLESAIMRRGLGVAGEADVRKALEYGYADMLIIDQDYENADAKEDLVRLAIGSGVDIETVKDSEKLARLSGVGCLLRYLPSYTPESQIDQAV